MAEDLQDGKLMPEDQARELAERYLRSRYYELEKVKFSACELTTIESDLAYRFQGTVFMKSRGIMDRFVFNKVNNSYRFKFDINAENGQIINYEFI